MQVQSIRFGEISVPDDKMITMIRPILGCESLRRFCLIEVDDLKPLLWLQSTENPGVSFLVMNPVLLVPGYCIEINPNEIAELEVTDVKAVETYVVVTVPENPDEISVNLQGPILINTENNRAKQMVLVNSDYPVQYRVAAGKSLRQEEPVAEEELVPA